MPSFTKKAIAEAFFRLLDQKPLDKITVKDIVEECDITRRTFYYHYQDIYDLLDVWMSTRLGMLKKSVPESKGWKEEVRVFLKYCQNHSKLVTNLLSSTSRSHLEHYIFTETDIFFYDYVRERTAGMPLSEESIRYIAQFYRYSFIGFFLKFTWEKMQTDVDESMDRLEKLFNAFIDSAAAQMERDPL